MTRPAPWVGRALDLDDGIGSLRDVDVEQIARLLDALDRSSLDFLRVEVGGTKLTVGRGTPPGAELAQAAQYRPLPEPLPAAEPPPPAPTPIQSPSPATRDGQPVASPLGGLFYSRPEPGAPPFVQLGSVVEQGATLGLVEVMKVFNAVAAPVRGTITDICVNETDQVAFGETLFRIRPDSA